MLEDTLSWAWRWKQDLESCAFRGIKNNCWLKLSFKYILSHNFNTENIYVSSVIFNNVGFTKNTVFKNPPVRCPFEIKDAAEHYSDFVTKMWS